MATQIKKVAKARFLQIGDRKLRQVARMIRGLKAEEALDLLNFMAKRKLALVVAKTLKSAVANAVGGDYGHGKVRPEDLAVTNVMVDRGPIAPRWEFRAMGRANRRQLRYSHLTVEVSGTVGDEPISKKSGAKKKAESKDAAKMARSKKSSVKKSTAKKASAKKSFVKKSAAGMKKKVAKKSSEMTSKKSVEKSAGAKKEKLEGKASATNALNPKSSKKDSDKKEG
ncbi:MAG: 50S ribosomal protein L22 [candidate division Zixibacteria bacterium]|nr:50S ribosomal protein L22 [candidate division Zixibacteria bacterium]